MVSDKSVSSVKSSYGSILKSSSIVGGSQGFVYAIRLLRGKLTAVLLGTAGVGLIGIYTSIINLVSTVSAMGLRSSGVREIASARGAADEELIGQLQLAIGRVILVLALAAVVFLAVASPWLSRLMFDGSESAALPIAFLGLAIIFKGLNLSQECSIRGFRRIGDFARISIIGALISALFAVGIYLWIGADGIVPVIVITAAVNYILAWSFSRKLQIEPKSKGWATSLVHSRRLIGLGAAVAYGAMLSNLPPLVARSLIVTNIGLSANGLYSAAWVISGMFAQFILKAMSADFFPRLAENSHDSKVVNQLVSEQTEIGILIALPGILATTAFAPLALRLLFTAEFTPAAELLPWLLLGVFARVVNWPMGMIMLAHGDSKRFALTQTVSVCLHVVLIYTFFRSFGLVGAVMGFALLNILYCPGIYLFLSSKYEFRWAGAVAPLLLISLILFGSITLIRIYLPEGILFYCCAMGIIFFGCGFSLYGLLRRLEGHPRLNKLLQKLPSDIVKRFIK